MQNSLLPENYKDANNLILEECIKDVLAVDLKKIMIYPVENVKEELLSSLAKENHIMGFEGWILAQTKKEKQDLIKNALIMHAKKGSMQSVQEALKKININSEILEFWKYGGRPGHYKINFLQIYERELTEKLENEIMDMIKNYAPKSRILDYINYFLCSLGNVYISSNNKATERVTITTKEAVI